MQLTTKGSAIRLPASASGFWNSGGGLFVVGVDGSGRPDGGISLNVGKQSRRDWIDRVISQVTPRGSYAIRSIENSSNCANIEPSKAVFLIGFCESEIGPHMANDNRYYIRAGAHTEPASHFIVEAIRARRGLRIPLLSHIVRHKPGNSDVIQLGIVVLNAAPAIDVSVETDALPDLVTPHLEEGVSLQVPIISEQFPLFFDVCTIILDEQQFPPFHVELTYSDIANRTYHRNRIPEDNRLENLVALCTACHLSYHNRGQSNVSPGQLSLFPDDTMDWDTIN